MGRIPVDTSLHQSTLLQRLNGMRDTKDHCNFTIRVGSTEISAHRNILSAGSDYFAAMLSHDTKEKQTGIVDIKEANPTCIKKCIDFIYTGIPPDLDDDIEQLMYSAHLLQLTTLCDGIFELLGEELSLKSFFLTRRLANMYDNKQLINNCDSFLLKNMDTISKMDQFVNFDKRFIEEVLLSKDTKISEACKLDALLRWVKFRAEDRKKFLVKMLKFVTFSKIPAGYLRHLIENETLINKDCDLILSFSIALSDNALIKSITLEASQTGDAIAVFDQGSGCIRCFNPTKNTWNRMHEMSDDMKNDNFTAVCVGGYIYVFMENKSIHRLHYLDEAATWEHVGAAIDNHGWRPPVVALHNCIYVVGGYNVETKSVEKFDILTSECTKLADKLHSTKSSALVELNNKIYCCGGLLDGRCTNIVDCFDSEALTWTSITSLNEAKCNMAAVECNKRVFILGGASRNIELQTVESYHPSSTEWTSRKKMNTKRHQFRCFELNGDIYAVGGYNSRKTIERFNSSKNEWKDESIPADISKDLQIVESVKIKLIQ